MKKLLFLLVLICVVKALHAQQPYVYTIYADSVKITNDCDTAELIIENHTQNVPGFLYNKGKGRTEFRRAIKLNDSTLVFGGDTLVIKGALSANNGLSITNNQVQLGQSMGAAGNPAMLLNNREIPMNGFNLSLSGSGKLIKGRTTDDGIGTIQNAGSYSYDWKDTNGVYAGSIRMLGQKFNSAAFFGLGNFTNIPDVAAGANLIVLGYNSGSAIIGGDGLIIGNHAGSKIVSPHNFIAIGNSALGTATVNENLAIGSEALRSSTTGVFNNAVGQYGTMINLTTGLRNNAFGTNAGYMVKTGQLNLFLGHDAGAGTGEADRSLLINPSSSFRDGQYFDCIFIGVGAGKQTSNAAASISNTAILGNGVTTDLNNVCVISNSTQKVILPGSGNIITTDNGARLQVNGTAFISDTLKLPNIISRSDTNSYKPMVADANGNVFKMASWDVSTSRKSATVTGSSYTIPSDIDVVFVNYTGGQATITLPTGTPDREITIKNLHTSNTVIVSGLDTNDSNSIATRGAITVKYAGSSWVGISKY